MPVFAGALGGAATVAVCAEAAVDDPAEFEAVMATRMVAPSSALARRWLVFVAPLIAVQFAPEESQRFHWYA
jgi:hypothetical protein